MKMMYLFLVLTSAIGIAQPRYAEIKIQQIARPDYKTASHAVITTVLARAANSYEWIPAYMHNTLVKKYRDSGPVKEKELERANVFGKSYLEELTKPKKHNPPTQEIEAQPR